MSDLGLPLKERELLLNSDQAGELLGHARNHVNWILKPLLAERIQSRGRSRCYYRYTEVEFCRQLVEAGWSLPKAVATVVGCR